LFAVCSIPSIHRQGVAADVGCCGLLLWQSIAHNSTGEIVVNSKYYLNSHHIVISHGESRVHPLTGKYTGNMSAISVQSCGNNYLEIAV